MYGASDSSSPSLSPALALVVSGASRDPVATSLRAPSTGEGVEIEPPTEVLIRGTVRPVAGDAGTLAGEVGLDGVTDRRWGHAETSYWISESRLRPDSALGGWRVAGRIFVMV